MGASDRRKLWICRFAWTTQTRCPHTHSSDRKKRRKRLEDSFEEEENTNGRRLYTLISTVPGPSDGVHLTQQIRALASSRFTDQSSGTPDRTDCASIGILQQQSFLAGVS